MKEEFREYYRPREEEFSHLWENCVFILDTNVLLNIYRYSQKPRKLLLKVIESIQKRLWMPYQVGKEFHRNRSSIIIEMEYSYDRIISILKNNIDSTKNEIKSKYRHHPLVDLDDLYNYMDKLLIESEEKIKKMGEKHPNFLTEDSWLEKLCAIYEGKVGPDYDVNKINEIIKSGKDRYAKKIPPGYMDIDKDKSESESEKPYGDLIIWHQIMDYAEKEKKSIIFVTDDRKEDWFLIVHGKNIGPRPELIREIKNKANVDFYAYQVDKFVDIASEKYNISIDSQSREEIRDISAGSFDANIIFSQKLKDIIQPPLSETNSSSSDPSINGFNLGDTVMHNIFGEGTVVGRIGINNRRDIAVSFPNIGIKSLPPQELTLLRLL